MQKSKLVLAAISFWAIFGLAAVPVSAKIEFRTGDIIDARNVTAGESGWLKSVVAKPLDEIEFRVWVENVGDSISQDVRVRIVFPTNPSITLRSKIHLGTWEAGEATGTVDVQVNDDMTQTLVYVPGKAVRYGGGCDGCAVSDNIATAYGAYVGAVKPQEKIEVRFRAQVTNRQPRVIAAASTPTPTPKPSDSTSAGTGGAAVASTTPETGFMDPVWVRTAMWFLLGAGGVGLRQAARKMGTIEV